MTIHPFSEHDWQIMRDLRLHALTDAPYAFGSTLEREKAFTEDDWRQRAGRPGGFWAECGAGPVGLAGTFVVPEELAHQSIDSWSWHPALVSMWVAPDRRGTGIAAELVEAVITRVRDRGATRLWLWVTEGNDRAIAFYRHLGFAETGDRQPVRPGEPAYEMRMALDLTAET